MAEQRKKSVHIADHDKAVRESLRAFLLDPKVGVFSLSFLPQFVPADVPAASFMFLLACLHAVLGCMWFGALIAATASLGGFVRRRGVVRWLDRLTAVVFVGFGLRLAVSATG